LALYTFVDLLEGVCQLPNFLDFRIVYGALGGGMTGSKTPQAGLLSAIPGADESVRIAIYVEHWGSVEFFLSVIEL
jgi:hypothetical protein